MDPYKARKVAKVIAIVLALAMIITSFSFVMVIPGLFGMEGSVVYAAANDDNDLDQQLTTLKEYMQYIHDNYKDEIDYDQMINGAFEGAINALGDPYSVYYSTNQEAETFIETVSGEYSGVGLSIETYDGKCRVVAPLSGTPAEKSGIKSGDIITKIDGVDLSSKTLDEAVALMRGAEGESVTLTINRSGQILTFTLTRELIKNVSVNYKLLDNKIGYVQITSFDKDSNVEFANAIAALKQQGMKSLIIDERNNPGGFVNVALEIANQLMPAGPIMHFMQKGKIVESYSADGTPDIDMPIVLLVNEGSASASEILAGALQDSKTATLVGTITFGKGVAQVVQTFDEDYGLKLSTSYFLTPNKTVINHVGITPDYTVQNSVNEDAEALAKEYLSFAPMSEKVKPTAGSVGLNVYGAQERLAMLGYAVKVSGTMDAETVTAVKKFQKESGLTAYGSLDYTTMTTLDMETIAYITGTKDAEDLQLEKAIDVLN